MSKIFIATPGDMVTGGPELCHQLADALNQDTERAFILYSPFDQRYDTPHCYGRYNAPVALLEDVEPGSVIVLPEIGVPVIDLFPGSDIYYWWMSVDRFIDEADLLGQDIETQLEAVRQRVTRHLYQSEYARDYLESHGLEPASRLSDRLSKEYLQRAVCFPTICDRRNLLVYNPAKGMPRSRKILHEMGKRGWFPKIVALNRMTSDEVRGLLCAAKVFIDFGDHPGKDRLPREAAACGAAVITNRRGAAANGIDIPIPDEFKMDDEAPGFQCQVVDKIYEVMGDFDNQQPKFDDYRKAILQESEDFGDDVAEIFG